MLLTSGTSADVTFIDLVFARLENSNALDNLDEFLTQLSVNGQVSYDLRATKITVSDVRQYLPRIKTSIEQSAQ